MLFTSLTESGFQKLINVANEYSTIVMGCVTYQLYYILIAY